MNIFIVLLLFLIGLLGGALIDFLFSLIKHEKNSESGGLPASKCKICFIMMDFRSGGKKLKILWRNLLLNLLTGLIFALFYIIIYPQNVKQWVLYAGYMIFVILLIAIFIYDLKYYLIPDVLVIPGIILAVLFSLVNLKNTFGHALVGAVICGGTFLILTLLSKEAWMGWGDVKLGIFIGFLMGWPTAIVGLFLSFVLGAIVSVALIILHKKKMKSAVPFGPFLVVGTLIVLLWGNYIFNWYLSLISL